LAGSSLGAVARETPRETIRRFQSDLQEFQRSTEAERVIVVNVASTEPPAFESNIPSQSEDSEKLLDDSSKSPLPASSLYAVAEGVIVCNVASTAPPAFESNSPSQWEDVERLRDGSSKSPLPASWLSAVAALDLGMPYINFAPSLGAPPEAISQLAGLRSTCH